MAIAKHIGQRAAFSAVNSTSRTSQWDAARRRRGLDGDDGERDFGDLDIFCDRDDCFTSPGSLKSSARRADMRARGDD